MNPENNMTPPETRAGTPASKSSAARTNNQIRASATADGFALKAKWKTLLAQARELWPKVPAEELAGVDGNIHKLAGLVQLRYRLDREESNRQVKEFFDRHDLSGGSVVPPK